MITSPNKSDVNSREVIPPKDDDGKEVSQPVKATIAFALVIFILFLVALYLFRKSELVKKIMSFLPCRGSGDRDSEPPATPMTSFNFSTQTEANKLAVPPPDPAYSKSRHARSLSSSSSITIL
ncbi:hypothetical protein E1B28_012806 [Marasmius oreades]|uniref:Uncharacterized protein n=1 Tax=Marasmius oreades TaxID=181124 RepID=A0A9P7RSV7_9AGAR|nr:uncharacterized protein E1B28_012806 [Marasmius oreades]KAG7088852.1 hypothetical protein E1B28_012806 [Marasmius oreades]